MAGALRCFIPLLLLLSITLFFFSYLHSSNLSPVSDPKHDSGIVSDQIPRHDFRLIVKVLAYNRLESLSRCLRSLATANYLSDHVDIHVYIDHFSGSDGADWKLEELRKIQEFAEGFPWRFGKKVVHCRTQNVGLQAQWLEAWWPISDDEFAFIVEDDLEVSPFYYKFLKSLIFKYYYDEANFRPYVYGASLQRPRFVPGKHGNKIHLESGTHLFLYQLVGTWGQLLFPKPWKEFRLWYEQQKIKGIKPLIDNMVTTGWYKRMGERIWTPWFIKFCHSRGYYNFYTNFSGERALSVSHRDPGVNYGKTAGPDSNLLNDMSLDFDLLDMQPMSQLKWHDFCFREVLPERVVRRADELGNVLRTVQQQHTLILVSLYGVSEMLMRNLICNFEQQNIRNYVFIGSKEDFLLDLARRGHPVIIGEEFLRTAITSKMTDIQALDDRRKAILAKAYVVKKLLELGYSSLVMEGNMLLPNGNPYRDFDRSSDFFAGESSELLFVRSSYAVRKIWCDKVVSNLARGKERTSFVRLVARILQQRGVKVTGIEGISFSTGSEEKTEQSSVMAGKKVIVSSDDASPDSIRKKLEELGVWMLDDDEVSCKGVYCHQS